MDDNRRQELWRRSRNARRRTPRWSPPPRRKASDAGPNYSGVPDRPDEVTVPQICEPQRLERLRPISTSKLETMKAAVSRLAKQSLQRPCRRQQKPVMPEFDLEEGTLDAGRLARVGGQPTTHCPFKGRTGHRIPRYLRDAGCSTTPARWRGRPISIARLRRCFWPARWRRLQRQSSRFWALPPAHGKAASP